MYNILLSRFVRSLQKDIYLPNICNAQYYNIQKCEECNCKIWCKFPPPGKPVYITEKVRNYKK